jgi:hypothetical protein
VISSRIIPLLAAAALITILSAPSEIFGRESAASRGSFLVTRFGARCDGISDDGAAFQSALDAAGAGCRANGAFVVSGFATVIIPDGARCRISRGLIDTKSDCVGIASEAGATLDFSGMIGGTALSLRPLAYGAYAGNLTRFSNLQIIGPGSSTDTVGIASATPNTVYSQLNIHGFGRGYEVRSGSWLNHFENSAISYSGVALYCGHGLKDAGEQISFDAGSLFNNGAAVENGSCEFNISDSSLDESAGPTVINSGGSTRLNSDHIEYVNNTASAALVVTSQACNAWSSITMEGGQIQFDKTAPRALASNDGGPGPCGGGGWGSYIRLNNVFFGNIPLDGRGAPIVGGTNSSQIAVCHATSGNGGGAMGNVPNIGRPYPPNPSQC